jgi:FtsH-binding integral membrane protein
MITEWNNFFTATLGGAAALTGLIFVGVSLSLTQILANSILPDRALISLVLLLTIVIVATIFLVPKQSFHELGGEILLIATLVWIGITRIDIDIIRKVEKQYKNHIIMNMIFDQLAMLPYIIAGIMIITTGESGIYWVVPAIIFSFIKAILDAWVLLVEIHR